MGALRHTVAHRASSPDNGHFAMILTLASLVLASSPGLPQAQSGMGRVGSNF